MVGCFTIRTRSMASITIQICKNQIGYKLQCSSVGYRNNAKNIEIYLFLSLFEKKLPWDESEIISLLGYILKAIMIFEKKNYQHQLYTFQTTIIDF